MKKVLIVAGDGIGTEIMDETKKIIKFLNDEKIVEKTEDLIGIS